LPGEDLPKEDCQMTIVKSVVLPLAPGAAFDLFTPNRLLKKTADDGERI
jgi:hypothetical protein